jgi:tripartite ATP-independent transporter DctM subunit
MDIFAGIVIMVLLLTLLSSGLWIGLSLIGVALLGMVMFTDRAAGDAMALTIWGFTSSWTLTALPLFLWMGEILFRSKLSGDLFRGLAPWLDRLPGRLLHVNVVGCTLFAAISGSSAATCATIGKITLPELKERGYPEGIAIGSLAGAATLGLLIPPSIVMIVYGVAANVSIAKLFLAGLIPGVLLAALFMLYIAGWSLVNKDKIPVPEGRLSFSEKIRASRHLIPAVVLIVLVLGSIYAGIATATEAAAVGVAGSFLISKIDGTLTLDTFMQGLASATRLYCMIGVILAGAAFLTLAMGFIGLPRHIAEYIGTLDLSQFGLLLLLLIFYLVLGCFLDGISMVVLTIAVLLPTLEAAQFDLIWMGVFIVIVVEMAQITPPVGFNLFVLQSLTKREIGWIAGRAAPTFFLMLSFAMILYIFPAIVMWLPNMSGAG